MVVVAKLNDAQIKIGKDVNTDHESRIRVLERDTIRTKAIASTIGGGVGLAAGIVAQVIYHAH